MSPCRRWRRACSPGTRTPEGPGGKLGHRQQDDPLGGVADRAAAPFEGAKYTGEGRQGGVDPVDGRQAAHLDTCWRSTSRLKVSLVSSRQRSLPARRTAEASGNTSAVAFGGITARETACR